MRTGRDDIREREVLPRERKRKARKNSERKGENRKESEEEEEVRKREKRRRKGRKEEKEETRWCGGEFLHNDFMLDGNNFHCMREERDENEKEIAGVRRKEEREGIGSPLRREKERGNGIIFRCHYFSLSRADERCKKGSAGEGKELSLTHAQMRGERKESGREREKIFSPLTHASTHVR